MSKTQLGFLRYKNKIIGSERIKVTTLVKARISGSIERSLIIGKLNMRNLTSLSLKLVLTAPLQKVVRVRFVTFIWSSI